MAIRSLLLVALVALLVSIPATFVAAQNPFSDGLSDAKGTATAGGILAKSDIVEVIADVILWLLTLSAVLALGALVWGGVMYIMSLGDEGRAEKAKKIVLFAISGVIIIILSYAIIAFVKDVLVMGPIPTAYAATDTSRGFNSGLGVIIDKIKPAESGLAPDTNIFPVIIRVVKILLGLVAALALAALVWASVMYILALGDEGRAEKAKKIIFYAIIGVLLSGFSFVILSALQGLIAPSTI